MVVQGLIALALALPTGMLFGVGYGTGVRIGYEQVYPLLFPKSKENNAVQVKENLTKINQIYDTIGGKEASNMGIAMGLNSVRTSTENNPDFLYLEELESRLSGRTPSSLDPHNKSSMESSLPPASSNITGNVTAYFQQYYASIPTMNLKTVTAEYGIAQQYKNGLSISQNNTFIIPALKTRLAQLRSTGTPQNITGSSIKTPVIGTLTKQTDSYVRAQYQNKVFTLLKKIRSTKGRIKTMGPGGSQVLGKTLNREIKALQSFITISRNNLKIKSLANNDWNKRIWNT